MIQVTHTVDVFLGTSVEDLGKVGGPSFRVAILGVVLPFISGFFAARLLMPELSLNVDLFVAATLGATSIGITARVLDDLGKTQSREARVILGDHHAHRFSIKDLIMPLEVILVPLFFVLMGVQVKLETFFDLHVLTMALGLLIAAVIGKLVSGIVAGKNIRKLVVGIGMMLRGEVGLIFASIGKSLGIINDELFSSVVLMVIVTTLLTPPLLKLSFLNMLRSSQE